MLWKCASFTFDCQRPIIMGVVNVTPDSFSDGGQFNSFDRALQHARDLQARGAHIIDVGGESTRPGAQPVSEEEELARCVDVVRALAQEGMCVSIDTRHARVARACVCAGAAIINDVSGFRDPEMRKVAAECNAGLVVMHMKGDPTTMQQQTNYTDIVAEVRDYLRERCNLLQEMGISRQRICVDPGPGFGKTAEQSRTLMRNLQEFVHLGYAVMCAPSRKSYVGATYGIEKPLDRDEASAQEALMGAELGACVLRMHNVDATQAALKQFRPLAVVALGCNVALVDDAAQGVDAKIAQLNMAIGALCSLPDTTLVDASRFYESEPAYKEDQPAFVNAVVALRTGIAPRDLLKYLHAIENSLGRVRTEENGPRTCDLDIIDYQLYVSDDAQLTLPHPRACERYFVVDPLREIMPSFVFANGLKLADAQPCFGKAEALTRSEAAYEPPAAQQE